MGLGVSPLWIRGMVVLTTFFGGGSGEGIFLFNNNRVLGGDRKKGKPAVLADGPVNVFSFMISLLGSFSLIKSAYLGCFSSCHCRSRLLLVGAPITPVQREQIFISPQRPPENMNVQNA